jgi:hypothetical protein
MANTDVISGGHTITAHAETTFTFWWPPLQLNHADTPGYFDVSISLRTIVSTPLLEVKREMFLEKEPGTVRDWRYMLLLTLRNDNDFDVNFIANHVRVH